MERNIAKIRKLMSEKDLDAFIIINPVNVSYFSNFFGSAGVLIITEKDLKLITDSRYYEQAQEQAKGFDVIEKNTGDVKFLAEVLKSLKIRRLGFEDNFINVGTYRKFEENFENIELVAQGDEIDKIRMVKEEWELDNIRKAQEIADKTVQYILNFIKPGIMEIELSIEMEYYAKKLGAEAIAFEPIIVSGKRSSLPHGKPSDKKLEIGDLITIDFGCVYRGYCSDMTRTFILGEVDAKAKEIYSIVLEAQERALQVLKSGIMAKDADMAARNFIAEKGYAENFGHGLGHGLGRLVHEAPRLSPTSEDVLLENMVVTVEPGIYVPGFGGVRIEDLVIIKNDGIENLTKTDKNITII